MDVFSNIPHLENFFLFLNDAIHTNAFPNINHIKNYNRNSNWKFPIFQCTHHHFISINYKKLNYLFVSCYSNTQIWLYSSKENETTPIKILFGAITPGEYSKGLFC
jgi:hypothetical protein